MFDDLKSFFNKVDKKEPLEAEFSAGGLGYAPRQMNATIIAITNQKGGTGKTTTAINLSAALAKNGFKVLLIDLDPQSHASLGVGIDIERLNHSVYDVMTKNLELDRSILHTYLDNFDVVPATPTLSGAQLEIADLLGREGILRTSLYKVLNTNQMRYDYVIIDTSPSLNLLTINGLVAAMHVLIPIQTHYFSLEGMKELFSTIKIVKDRLNFKLDILGILPTLFDSRTRMNRDILEQTKEFFRDKVFQSIIHLNVKLAEAAANRKSVFDYAPGSRGARDYASLTKEVISLTKPERKDEEREERFSGLTPRT